MKKPKLRMWLTTVMTLAGSFTGIIPFQAFTTQNQIRVIIHYHRNDGNYDQWHIWGWIPSLNGATFNFTREDSFGKIVEFKLDNINNSTKMGFILRKGNWQAREASGDRFGYIKDGKVEIWVIQGEDDVYTSEADAIANLAPKLRSASIQTFNKVQLRVNVPIKLTGEDNEGIEVKLGDKELQITNIKNTYAGTVEELGFEMIGSTIHFVLVPSRKDVPALDSNGASNVFVAGGFNGWYINGAEGWKMTWNLNKKYYELTKILEKDASFGDEFKFINIVNEYTNWMNGNNLKLLDYSTTDNVDITLKENIVIDKALKITKQGYKGEVFALISGNVFTSKEFNDNYFYDGNDLGYTYSKEKTTFRLWAPLADKVSLVTYLSGDIASKALGTSYEMKKDIKGTWVATLQGDQNGVFYTYKVNNYGTDVEVGDPYAKAVGVNGDRSAVVDLSATNPIAWDKDSKPALGKINDAVIYELHIRDLAMNKGSGIKNKGKYIEFTEEGTKGPGNVKTGIDHLKELGITHLHLLPSYDYGSIDEKTLDQNKFNWGYDPKNYNVPEGSYSTDPYKPEVRINEYKQMVQSLHKNGICVVFDAVYNHTYESVDSNFHKIVPGYYHRMQNDCTFHNGTGCGNETASERPMVRKYIVDSVKYWVTEYHIDGFRFDLMGIHDAETMNAVRKALNAIDPSIIVYGEGWDMGNLPRHQRAIQPHAKQMPGIGFFNDNVRDNLKGAWENEWGHGFIDGKQNCELEVIEGVAGSIGYTSIVRDYNENPGQSVNYVANHDNNTLWDKLILANPNASQEDIKKMHKLANTIVFTSQGVSYLHAGEDFLRSKGGDSNSYASPDSVNALDWSRKANNIDVFNYYKGLIALRKLHPAFRMPTAEMIQQNLVFIDTPRNTVGFVLKDNANNDSWKNIFVAYNANTTPVEITLPEANWNVVLKGDKAGVETLETFKGSRVTLPPLSSIVAHTYDAITVKDMFEGKRVIKTRVNSSKLAADGKEIDAVEKLAQQGETIYLPIRSVAEALGGEVEWKVITSKVEITIGNDKVAIILPDCKALKNGKEITVDEGIKIVNERLMVPAKAIEKLFDVKVLADYHRYTETGDREDGSEPDVFIVY